MSCILSQRFRGRRDLEVGGDVGEVVREGVTENEGKGKLERDGSSVNRERSRAVGQEQYIMQVFRLEKLEKRTCGTDGPTDGPTK